MSGIVGKQPEKYYPKFEPLAETIERVIDNIGKRNGKPEFETGLQVVDRGLFGFHRSQMTTIAARPGIGKTALVCQMAIELAKKKCKVAFISLEMTKETILERMFCQQYGINGFDLLMGKLSPAVTSGMEDFFREAEYLSLRIIDDYCFTESELYTLVDHLEFRPDIMIIDHLQHIRSAEKRSNWENLTEYLRFLKEMAMRHKIAIVVLSQINRAGDEAPTLATMKGTGALEEMSDHVLLMHQLKEPDGNENFKILVAKNRFGPVGTFNLYFDCGTLRFFNSYQEMRFSGK